MPREQLVHRHVGEDLDFVSSAARRAGQKRSGGARVDVVPARLDARQHEHLIPERRQRLQNGRQLERGALPFRRPVLHGHPVRHIERLEPVHRLRGARPRRENAGSIASRNGSASVAPSPRRTVRRGNDFVRNAISVSFSSASVRDLRGPSRKLFWSVRRRPAAARIRNAGLFDNPQNERRPAVVVRRRVADDLSHGRPIVVLEPSAERIGQQFFGDGARKLLGLARAAAPAVRKALPPSRRSPWCRSRRRACPIRQSSAIRR